MRQVYWTYLGIFLVFLGLVIAIMVQNLSWAWEVSVLWMKTSVMNLVLIVGFFWLVQGVFLILFIKALFRTAQRAELSKFDLDKPL